MSESSPMCNVIHMGLTEGTKADPVCEMAEYFIQERENDLFKIILLEGNGIRI